MNVGLGFRRDITNEINNRYINPDFIELAPENWIEMGGYWKQQLDEAASKYPITCHGLSLSIGSEEELDWNFLKKIKKFLESYNVKIYSEHLSYTKSKNTHLYDLLPIPFKRDAIEHIVNRIKQVQDFLKQKIAIENVSYYTPVAAELSEVDFINEILEKSGCNLLLDINNVYVNAFNQKYDAKEFLNNLALEKVSYMHIAGHEQVSSDLIIDTHGQPIIDPVFDLFEWVIKKIKPVPVLLERDFNFDDIQDLKNEYQTVKSIYKKQWTLANEPR